MRFGLDRRILDILEDRKIKNLRLIQKKALQQGILQGENIFISAPSGSGKTFLAEIIAVQNILSKRLKSVLLVPLRALANEKYSEFVSNYSKLGIKIAIRTGDIEIEKIELHEADLIISTYERFDSLLRNEINWLNQIGTIIIDEVHIINDFYRGPRLESLLARLREYLPEIQLIALSATIENPEDLAKWLKCKLITSKIRPVKLNYKIYVTADKNKTIKELVYHTLKSKGQILIFTKTRKESQKIASDLVKTILDNQLLDDRDRIELNEIFKAQDLTSKTKLDRSLINIMKFGVAYHHAGLSLETRQLVEKYFRRHLIKIIACTTTLAAGVNLPAKVVVVKDCQVIITDPNVIVSDDQYWWKNQLDNNLLHQILGRAGRPGYDDVGIGIILTPTNADAKKIASFYFHIENGTIRPKYGNVQSWLNQTEMLYEQVLVRLKEKNGMTQEEILEDFKKTYWWFRVQNDNPEQKIDQLIEIGALSVKKTLAELATREMCENAGKIPDENVKLTNADNNFIAAIINDGISHTCAFYKDHPSCTCSGFKHSEYINQFILCRHLIKLIEVGMKKYPRLTNDLVCLSLHKEFILDSLLKMKMAIARGNKYYISDFGRIITQLLIKPSSAMVIKYRLSNILTLSDLIETIRKLFEVEHNKYLDPMFVQLMIELIKRSKNISLDFKILEVSEKYFKGQGDIEEYIHFTKRMANAINKIARLYDFQNISIFAKEIINNLS